MNAERLLALYDRVADAPDAVDRLRRFVLDLAVRGKLVEQDPADEPASKLLKRIAAEKARLLKAREIRKPRAVAPLDENGFPFSLPTGWEWAQLAQLGVVSPRNEAPDDHKASFVPMRLISAEYGAGHQHETRPWADIRKGYTHFAEGDVGLAKITPCFENGKSTVFRNLTGGVGSGTTELHVVRPLFVTADYIVLFFKSSHFIETGILRMTGTAGQKRVPTEYFTSSPFPLPPLAEQRRIVAKVDELMALCDRLVEIRTAREDTRDRLTKASLTRLTAPETDTAAFQGHARFAIHALPALTARVDQVKQLRQTILSLAVRGKLVEQDSTEEAASVLLKRIDSARKLAPTQGRKTKGAAIRSSLADSAFALPAGWARARLSQLVRVLNGRAYKKAELLDSGTPVLRVGNLFTSKHWYYSDLQLAEDKYCDEGDLLYAWSASFGPVIWQGPRVIFHYHIWKLSLFSEADLDKRFLYYLLLQQTQEIKSAGHGVSMVHMTKGKMERLPVPLPPLAEQHRIVATVDALMALCDQLEAGLDATGGTRNRLLGSLLQDTLTSSSYEAAVVGAISA